MDKHHTRLEDVIDEAAGILPEGWLIEICVEQGAAFIRLEDQAGEGVCFDSSDMTLTEQVRHATKLACDLSA